MKIIKEKLEIITDSSQINLIDISTLSETFKLDIRYATSNNFIKRPAYQKPKAYLQEEVATDLLKINNALNKQGFGLVIFDAYRPWSITKIFWDETPEEKRNFVANPAFGSNHNRGCAIDLSLYDLNTGRDLQMPSEFDVFNESAFPSFKDADVDSIRNRDFLINEFETTKNFKVYPYEWWHFDHKSCKNYPIIDIPFEDL